MTGPWWRSRAADERGPGGRRDRGGWERDARGRAVAAHVRLGGTGLRLTERVRATRRTAWLVGMAAGAGRGWRGRLDLGGRGTGCRPRPIRGRVARACQLRGLRVGRGGSGRAGDQVAGAKPLRRQNRQAEQQRQESIRHLRPRRASSLSQPRVRSNRKHAPTCRVFQHDRRRPCFARTDGPVSFGKESHFSRGSLNSSGWRAGTGRGVAGGVGTERDRQEYTGAGGKQFQPASAPSGPGRVSSPAGGETGSLLLEVA